MSEVISTQELLDKYYPFPDTTSSPEMVEDVVLQSIYIPPQCECVRYLREVLNVPIRGNAKDIRPNTDIPLVGGVVLQTIDGVAHASQIQWLLPKCMYVKEGNKVLCKATERCIPYDDKSIRGYWFKNLNAEKP